MPEIEIFRIGTHTAMSGQTLGFSADDLQGMAQSYDPGVHESPICVGHPKHDGPAYGWVKGLRAEGGALFADLDQVEPQFAELVRDGRYKKISAAFYPPDASTNPVPGKYYLRHVGFLGAQPPSIKGLKPVQFAEDDQVLEFGDWNDRNIAWALRGLRDWLIAKFGQDEADKALPGYTVDSIQEAAAQPEPGSG